jgi:ATP-dependent Lon protease
MSGGPPTSRGLPAELPPQLPLLALSEQVLFPKAMLPLELAPGPLLRAVEEAMRTHRVLAVLARRAPGGTGTPAEGELHPVGCAGAVAQRMAGREGRVRLVLEGLERIRLRELVPGPGGVLLARVESAPVAGSPPAETEGLVRALRALFRELVGEVAAVTPALADAADAQGDPRRLATLVATSAPLSFAARQEVLEAASVAERLERLVRALRREMEVRQIEREVLAQTQAQLGRTQREHVLREHLRTIQRELGGEAGDEEELDVLRAQLDRTPLSEEARREAQRELARLQRIPPASPEHGMVRTWLETLLALPWERTTGEAIDMARAHQVLDEDHYDLSRIKDRILDSLAVRKLRQERGARVSLSGPGDANHAAHGGPLPETPEDEARREPILCFVGPPGVGKTSLGHSIARAMGRRFVRISLGGVHDASEIRGHRRTYVGALPGRLLQALKRAETLDPVLMLDEVDKLSSSFQGDPAAALLEVLDPAQNHTFQDAYLGLPFDLSRVLFICTANTTETIPAPLLDRMEVLALSGYTEAQKHHIARRYLLPRQVAANGLREGELEVDDGALVRVIREYTREAGVRSLERELSGFARKAARRISEGEAAPIRVGPADVPALLGRPRYFEQVSERVDRPGVVTGLAWTPAGGDILFVEAALVPGREGLVLTGMLGDVMRESVQTAVSYVRSRSRELGLGPALFEGHGVHVHVPAGAIPKDGPSAGAAMVVAVASLARGVAPRNDTAVTGEITLRGKVLPVGGVKEKVLAAYRAGLKRVVLPRRNEPDLEELAPEVHAALSWVLVDSADEVLEAALGGPQPDAGESPPH